MVKPFPNISLTEEVKGNPAMLLYGPRFFTDQSIPELLVELLLVASSPKKIGDLKIDQLFPDRKDLINWPEKQVLRYSAKARLNLKLFSFLGASKLETRHECHRQHYRELVGKMKTQHLKCGSIDPDDVLRTLENLFLGFQGAGADRTWCAQSFLPITKSLLAAETIWNVTEAKRNTPDSWDQILDKFNIYYSLNRHRFLARGGELLYLQICNALRQDPADIQAWCTKAGINYNSDEYEPGRLSELLQSSLSGVLDCCPQAIDKLANLIDTGIDEDTSKKIDQVKEDTFAATAWCPAESWPEGLLFAVEMARICRADIDPIKRIELMEVGCALQVLRSLFAQSARYVPWVQDQSKYAGPFGYVLALSDPDGLDKMAKQISHRNIKAIQRMLYEAIRHPEIAKVVAEIGKYDTSYKQADNHYGHKFFIGLAKRLGLIIPRRGAGARFVMNELLLRYLVMALIPPGKRVTYDTFKDMLFKHHGMAVDSVRIGNACVWSGTGMISTLAGSNDSWLMKMLDESGVLVRLSDAHSLVINPFSSGETA